MSAFEKVVIGGFGFFVTALIAVVISSHQNEIAEWGTRQRRKFAEAFSAKVARQRKNRELRRAKSVASEMES